MIKLLLITILFFTLKFALAFHPTYQCSEYLKIHNELQCSKNHYLKTFAHKYCLRYQENTSLYSTRAQKWLTDVKQCLLERLVESKENHNCDSIVSYAYQNHTSCYIEKGFCKLPFHDKKRVLVHALDGLKYKNVWQTAIAIAKICQY
jgi:hypothetical protein